MAAAIGVPENRIRFNPVAIGGDFGGKGSLMDTLLCYYLARAARRPVKMVMNSFEELTAGNPRHSASITLAHGARPRREDSRDRRADDLQRRRLCRLCSRADACTEL